MRCARDDGTHAHTNRDAHLASLTPLIGEAQVRGCARRARAAQRRSRGATEARGVHLERHVMKAAYILHIPQYRVIFFHIVYISCFSCFAYEIILFSSKIIFLNKSKKQQVLLNVLQYSSRS